eukprot:6208606-Pleurochrysis_carterae.AAC.1
MHLILSFEELEDAGPRGELAEFAACRRAIRPGPSRRAIRPPPSVHTLRGHAEPTASELTRTQQWMDPIWLITQGESHSLTLAAARQMRLGFSTRLQTRSFSRIILGVLGHGMDLWRIRNSRRRNLEVLHKEPAAVYSLLAKY